MVINNLKYSAQLIAPNPKEIDYWIDLKEDPNGGIIKYYNGITWDYLNQMDEQNEQLNEILERLQELEQGGSSSYTFTNGSDGSFTVNDGDSTQKVTIGKPATAGTADKALSVEWNNVANKTVASNTADGLMSSTDKTNLTNLVNNTNGYQTASQVQQSIANVVGSAPDALDTLYELAEALDNDPNFATTITNYIGQKADKTTATTSANGLMSSTDKSKLDTIAEGANKSADFNALVSAQTLEDPEQEYITVSFTTQNTLTGSQNTNASGSTIYAANSDRMGYMTSTMYDKLNGVPNMQIVAELPSAPDENTIYFVTGE